MVYGIAVSLAPGQAEADSHAGTHEQEADLPPAAGTEAPGRKCGTGRNPCSRRDVPLTGALSAGRQASLWLTTSRGAWSGVNKITW
jgi:hypothetical protein